MAERLAGGHLVEASLDLADEPVVVVQRAFERLVRERFQLTPRGIIDSLGLERPIYAQTASYGHFGRTDVELPWEKVA